MSVCFRLRMNSRYLFLTWLIEKPNKSTHNSHHCHFPHQHIVTIMFVIILIHILIVMIITHTTTTASSPAAAEIGDMWYCGKHMCRRSLPPMLESGFESQLGLGFLGFSIF